MAFTYAVLMVATLLVVFFISFRVTEEAVRTNSRQYAEQLVGSIAYTVNTYIDSMDSLAAFIASNEDIYDYFRKQEAGDPTEDLRKRVQESLSTVIRNRKDVSLIALISMDGRILFHDESLEPNPFIIPRNQGWYQAAIEAGGRAVFSSSHVQNLVKQRYFWVVSLSKLLFDQSRKKPEAVLLIDLNYRLIEDLCTNVSLGKRGYVFIVDPVGNLVFHPRQQVVYSGLRQEHVGEVLVSDTSEFEVEDQDGLKLYSIVPLRKAGWKVIGVSYLEELGMDRRSLARVYTAWGVVFLGLTILFSFILSLRIARPIKLLRDTIKVVEQGNFDIQARIERSDEIGELGQDFNIMVQKIKELLQLIIEEQQNKRKSELKALQAQINPHFLYNTLDSVIWMAEDRQHQQVIEMVAALAKLFRLSISGGREMISIGEEVEHVRQYLIIQKMRYKDRLDYEIRVPRELFPYRTVKIILQPLVENAIYHGIKNSPVPGKIEIDGCIANGGIELSVKDNGVGMSAEILSRMSTDLEQGDRVRSRSSGVGVRNVDERIKLYFGKEYGVEFYSTEGEGTEVKIRLPSVRGEEA
ncbi:MAG: sensor histidine kinase [Spirochaetales bacterium]